MKHVAYGWRMATKAALRWAVKAQKEIEERLEVIENNPSCEAEYLDAKATWKALRSAEVKIRNELNNSKL